MSFSAEMERAQGETNKMLASEGTSTDQIGKDLDKAVKDVEKEVKKEEQPVQQVLSHNTHTTHIITYDNMLGSGSSCCS